MKRAFTLVELLVVIGVIAVLMAIIFPVMALVRERGNETVCQSNLRQMAIILKTYCSDHDGMFPNPNYLYHSRQSFFGLDPKKPPEPPTPYYGAWYPWTERSHEAEIGPGSRLLHEHTELQGALIPYLGSAKLLLCKTGVRAYLERGYHNGDPNKLRRPQPVQPHHSGGGGWSIHFPNPDPNIHPSTDFPQYCYTMNGNLYRTLWTASTVAGSQSGQLDPRTFREWNVRREANVTRSPAEVFAFGEENSWTINTESRWPAPFNLSGPWGGTQNGTMEAPTETRDPKVRAFEVTGAITGGSLDIGPSYTTFDTPREHPFASKMPETDVGDAFATYHHPRNGDLNTGHSYISMLDGHVEKVTVPDQLRQSRRPPGMAASRFGPGGNLNPAWPLSVPPIGGWENQ